MPDWLLTVLSLSCGISFFRFVREVHIWFKDPSMRITISPADFYSLFERERQSDSSATFLRQDQINILSSVSSDVSPPETLPLLRDNVDGRVIFQGYLSRH